MNKLLILILTGFCGFGYAKNTIPFVTGYTQDVKQNPNCCPQTCEQKQVAVCEKPKPKVITRTKVVEKPVPVIVEKEVVRVVEQRIPVKVVERVPVRVTRTVTKKENKKNRISAIVGSGPTKLSIDSSEARLERGLIYGLQYQRLIDSSVSVGIQIQNNNSINGSLGFDF